MAVNKKSSPKPQIIYPLIMKEEARKDIVESAQWYATGLADLSIHFIQYL